MTPFPSTWQSRLPEDEIGRQQAVKERLQPGCTVELRYEETPLGRFVYSGIWDTMHAFYPLPENPIDLEAAMGGVRRRYLRRDLRGRLFLQLPYTILADVVASVAAATAQ